MAIRGTETRRRASANRPLDGVRPPSESAQLISRRSAPAATAATASSTDATQISIRTRLAVGITVHDKRQCLDFAHRIGYTGTANGSHPMSRACILLALVIPV